MGVIDLSVVRRLRQEPGARFLWDYRHLWAPRWRTLAGRAQGIIWARERATPEQLANFISHWLDPKGTPCRDMGGDTGPHALLYQLTHFSEPLVLDDEMGWFHDWTELLDFKEQLPVVEAVRELVELIGESDATKMFESSGFARGWAAGAVDYWETTQPPD